MLSVLPSAPEGLRALPGIHDNQHYIAAGWFLEGAARNEKNVQQAPVIFQDADLQDYIRGYDSRTFNLIRDVEAWATAKAQAAYGFRKVHARAIKAGVTAEDGDEGLFAWMRSALDGPDAHLIVKAWLHTADQAADMLDELLDDQFDFIHACLKTIGRLPKPTVITRSGYGHHFYWWLQDGQGRHDGPPASNVAAVQRVAKNIAALVNKTASFSLFDPVVASHAGYGYCREIGSANTKGRHRREVEAVWHQPAHRIDLRALVLPATPAERATGLQAEAGQWVLSAKRAGKKGASFEVLDPGTEIDFGDDVGRLTILDWLGQVEPGESAKCCCPFSASNTVGSAKIYVNDNGAVFLNCWAPHHDHPHYDGKKALWIYDPQSAAAGADDEDLRSLAERLNINDKGKPTPGSLYNLEMIAAESPEYKGRLWWSERQMAVMIDDRPIKATDITKFQLYCETHFDIIERSTEAVLTIMTKVACEHMRNEVKEWWESVPWDGEERLETWLIHAAGVEDTILHRAYSRKFLISVVARVYDPGCKLDQVLLLMGSQGAKKSTLFQKLIGPQWFSDSFMDLGNKDAYMQLYKAVIYEWSENFKGGQLALEREKAFITSQRDTFRPPYGKIVETFDRHTVIVATSNLDHPLVDPTGSRRWWPIVVADRIDLDWIEETRDQLWAEALVHYKKHVELGGKYGTGYEWWIEKDSDLDLLRRHKAEEFTREDPRLDMVTAWAKKRLQPVTLTQLGEQVLAIPPNDITKHTNNLTQLLREAGFARLERRRDDDGKRVTRWLSPYAQLPDGEKFATAEDARKHKAAYKQLTPEGDNVIPLRAKKGHATDQASR